jgi:tripeptidyl-peptidase-1
VEYTPQSYLQTDLNMFFANYSSPLVGKSPNLNPIDGGTLQTTDESFAFNGESDLDLEYAMTLVYPQQVRFYGCSAEHSQTKSFILGYTLSSW